MNTCPNCHKELSGQSAACAHCGCQLAAPTAGSNPIDPKDDGLDIVVTEAHDTNPTLILGSASTKPEDNLGVQSNAELVQFDQSDNTATDNRLVQSISEQIGESEPPPPPGNADLETTNLPISAALPSRQRESTVQKLTAEQVKSIRRDLYREDQSYLDDQEKAAILKNVGGETQQSESANPPHKGFDTAPITANKKDKSDTPAPLEDKVQPTGPKSKMAERSRGVAYFAKHLIKVTGGQELYEGDELTINNRCYVLRKKKIDSKTLFVFLVPVAALLLFWLGTHFTQDNSGGSGQIVGLALDQSGRPHITGASVRIPELNQTVKTNSQGFFKSGQIERGSYKIEYVVNDDVVGTDFATVVEGEVTMLTLKADGTPKQAEEKPASLQIAANSTPQQTPSAKATQNTPPAPTPEKSKPAPSKASSTSPAKLRLAANTNNAQFTLDGKVLGAGNLTYSGLKPGTRSWKVAADGFVTKTGEITLASGKTSELKVTLEPMQQAAKEKVYDYEQFYNSGKAAFEKGQYAQAIADFDQAIEKKPSYADAHMARAEARDRSKDADGAHDGYILAAEQYRLARDHSKAFTCYSRALSINDKSISAYIGRGSLYLSRGEEIAAVTDFEAAKDIDKRNVQVYLGLGEVRFRQGLYDKAIKHFNDGRSLDNDNPVPYQFLMLCYMAKDDMDRVKASYDRFVEVATDKEIDKLHSNGQYSAVLRVIESYDR